MMPWTLQHLSSLYQAIENATCHYPDTVLAHIENIPPRGMEGDEQWTRPGGSKEVLMTLSNDIEMCIRYAEMLERKEQHPELKRAEGLVADAAHEMNNALFDRMKAERDKRERAMVQD